MYKKIVGRGKEAWARMRGYWRGFLESKNNKMSRGAQNIYKGTPAAHGDEWAGRNNHHHKSN